MAPKTPLYRNSTSFPALSSAKFRKYFDEYKEGEEGGRDAAGLKYYQALVRRVMTDPFFGVGRENGGRGLLVYHDMGMGKTLLSVAIAMAMLDARRPLIVAPKGLHKNFSAALRQYLRMARPELADAGLEEAFAAAFARFRFVSVDAYNMAAQVAKATTGLGGAGSLDEHLLIVDEAHNLFRGVINSSKPSANARQLYEMVMAAKNLRLLFLTGTPITKNPFELVPCFNMLAGFNLLPTDYERFTGLYVNAGAKTIRNRGRLGNRLLGLVSHVAHGLPNHPGASAPGQARDGFPRQLDTTIERVQMSPEQYRAYVKTRLAEEKETVRRGDPGRPVFLDKPLREGPKLALPSASGAKGSTYHVGSRSVSNYAPPAAGGAAFAPHRSPKIVKLLENVATSPGPVLVYSQFVSKGGLAAVAGFLSEAGYRRYEPAASPPEGGVRRFAVISGQTPEKEREAVVAAFNAPANARGGVIRALLVSKTGAEGLDLKCLRQIHVLEPYWDKARENQVIARGVRLGSHDQLPPDEREVRPFLYLATANPEVSFEKPFQEDATIDEAFHARAVAKDALNAEFRGLLRAVALECTVNGYGRCHFCAPTGVRLFQGDPGGDLDAPEPCAPVAEKEVSATPFDYDGERYFWSPDPTSPNGVVFYVFDGGLGGHRAVPPSSELFERLHRAHASGHGAM